MKPSLNLASELNRIAIAFLSSENPAKKAKLLKQAKAFFKSLPESLSRQQIRQALGVSYFAGVDSSSKIIKGKKQEYTTVVLYLLAGKQSGINVCPDASEGCLAACLVNSGKALMGLRKDGACNHYSVSRLKKTWLAVWRRDLAEICLDKEIELAGKKAKRLGNKLAVRLNGTSDIDWTSYIQRNPSVQFYDYTKRLAMARKASNLANWHVTFSFSGTNLLNCIEAIQLGSNLAVPVASKALARELVAAGFGYSQDETDLRFLDSIKNPFGILAVKETPGTKEGIEKGFLLDSEGFHSLRDKIAA